jgi:NTE family protein
MKVGVSLGSGGSRGFAHLGVLRALEDAKVPIDLVNGSSIGAVVGATYALHHDAEDVAHLVQEVLPKIDVGFFNLFRYPASGSAFLRNWLAEAFCNLSALQMSIVSHRNNRRALGLLLGARTFADTVIPFSVATFDLLAGETVILKEGRLADAILASISIPGIFPPVERDGRLLVDGAVQADVPVRELRVEGAEFVIGVRLVQEVLKDYRNGFGLLIAIDQVKSDAVCAWELAAADVAITIDLPGYDMARFGQSAVAMEAGYDAARRALPTIVRRLEEAR